MDELNHRDLVAFAIRSHEKLMLPFEHELHPSGDRRRSTRMNEEAALGRDRDYLNSAAVASCGG